MNASGLIAGLAFAAFVAMPLPAQAETVSGKIVDLATYVTRDHNMDAMHASMPGKSSAMMHEGAMMPHACPPALGLVTNNGVGLYLLVTQMDTKTAETLCRNLDKNVTVSGTTYEKSGLRALLVSSTQ
jgi:hypothetical protein